MNLIVLLVTGAIALLLISATLAPLEALGWYAGWFGEKAEAGEKRATSSGDAVGTSGATGEAVSHYVIYLSGIGAIAANSIPDEEAPFIQGLQEMLPSGETHMHYVLTTVQRVLTEASLVPNQSVLEQG